MTRHLEPLEDTRCVKGEIQKVVAKTNIDSHTLAIHLRVLPWRPSWTLADHGGGGAVQQQHPEPRLREALTPRYISFCFAVMLTHQVPKLSKAMSITREAAPFPTQITCTARPKHPRSHTLGFFLNTASLCQSRMCFENEGKRPFSHQLCDYMTRPHVALVEVPRQHRTSEPWGSTRAYFERGGGGGGVWDPKVCVSNMARPDFPIVNFVFPTWSLWSGEGGGGFGGRGWHKALVVGSVSLWRRLLASRL